MPPTPPAPDGSRPSRALPAPRLRPATALNVLLLLLALVAFALLALRGDSNPGVEVERREAPPGVDDLLVEVRGAVAQPGLVEANPGDRVADVVQRAGGALPAADVNALNLALRVRDQDLIHVPLRGEVAFPLVDLNTATPGELEALPGIGPVRAASIIRARPLASVEELLERGLVPASVFEELRPLVTVR